jgi:hypothetical protein
MYLIKVQQSMFHKKTYKATKHWIEFTINNTPIIPRLVILGPDNAMFVVSGILSRDWSIHGIPNATNQGIRPLTSENTTSNAAIAGLPILGANDAARQTERAATESNEPATGPV